MSNVKVKCDLNLTTFYGSQQHIFTPKLHHVLIRSYRRHTVQMFFWNKRSNAKVAFQWQPNPYISGEFRRTPPALKTEYFQRPDSQFHLQFRTWMLWICINLLPVGCGDHSLTSPCPPLPCMEYNDYFHVVLGLSRASRCSRKERESESRIICSRSYKYEWSVGGAKL